MDNRSKNKIIHPQEIKESTENNDDHFKQNDNNTKIDIHDRKHSTEEIPEPAPQKTTEVPTSFTII